MEHVDTRQIGQIATKRLAVKPGTWEALSFLKRPGETFDDLLMSMVHDEQKRRLFHDLDVAAAEPSIPWSKVAEEFRI